MAARANKIRHDEQTRKRIQIMVIVKRLMDHIESDEPLMDASQVSAAKALLNKCLPDLRAVEVTGENGGPVQVQKVERVVIDAADTNS